VLTDVQAIERLARVCDAAEEPAISNEELAEILDDNLVARLHVTETAYVVGDRVFPATPNGRQYVCVEPGTSGATAPTWPKASQSVTGRQVPDGTDLIWEDDGPAHSDLWDMGAAKKEALNRKAELCAKLVNRSDKDTRTDWSRMAEAYRAQAANYDSEFLP
jgi:hypothetical protein